MSATVENPNEIAKVKHLLSLAQSINDKIDAAISGSSQSDTRTPLYIYDENNNVYDALTYTSGKEDPFLKVVASKTSTTVLTINGTWSFSGLPNPATIHVSSAEGEASTEVGVDSDVSQTLVVTFTPTDTDTYAPATFTITVTD